VRVGDILFLAGQCGLDEQGRLVSPAFEPQARRALERVRLALAAAGASIGDIVNMTVYLVDPRYGEEFLRLRNEFYGQAFPHQAYPASTTVAVTALLPPHGLVEVQVQAVARPGQS
jgi:enamine deaminase RidA (YjgF/YER057c/UK114 family)